MCPLQKVEMLESKKSIFYGSLLREKKVIHEFDISIKIESVSVQTAHIELINQQFVNKGKNFRL